MQSTTAAVLLLWLWSRCTFSPSGGLGACKQELQGDFLDFVVSTSMPAIIGGAWNTGPAAILESGQARPFSVQILAPEEATCQGLVLGFFECLVPYVSEHV